MRELKFRVWNNSDRKMLFNVSILQEAPESEYGTLVKNKITGVVGIERSHIMQYTGIKDKNNKEILSMCEFQKIMGVQRMRKGVPNFFVDKKLNGQKLVGISLTRTLGSIDHFLVQKRLKLKSGEIYTKTPSF